MKTLSIIIPVFNEEKTVGVLLEKVMDAKLPGGFKKEILIIDDGSSDNTKQVLSKCQMSRQRRGSPLAANVKCQIFRHNTNKGKGAAIRTGLKHVKGDFIIIQDADLEYDPNDYNKLLEPMLKKGAKIVFGTRLKNYPLRFWGKNKTVLPLHLIANKFLTNLLNFLYGSKLTDMETCYKLFAKDVIKKLKLKSKRFEIEPELTIKSLKLGYNIVEVPIKTKPRRYSEGKKIGFFDGILAIWTIIKYK